MANERNLKAVIKRGINEDDTLKQEKAQASIAAWDLLCCHPKQTKEEYVNRIKNAKNSGQISQILREVRDIM